MSEIAESELKHMKKISLGVAIPVALVVTALGIVAYHFATNEKDDDAEEKASKEK